MMPSARTVSTLILILPLLVHSLLVSAAVPTDRLARHRHAAAIQPTTVWSSLHFTAVAFPVDGGIDSCTFAAVSNSPPRVLCVKLSTGAVASSSFLLPAQSTLLNLVANTSHAFLLLQADGSAAPSIVVLMLNAGSLTVAAAYELLYPLQLLGVNAAGDTLLTTVQSSSELVALHSMTGRRRAVYDRGLSELQVWAGALHPTSGVVYAVAVNGSLPEGEWRLLSIGSNNSLLSSVPLPLSGLFLLYTAALDLSGRYLSLLYYGPYELSLEQFDVSTGQPLWTLYLPDSQPPPSASLSPAAMPKAMLTVDSAMLLQVVAGNASILTAGSTPPLHRPSSLALLRHGRGNDTVLVAVDAPTAVYELDTEGGAYLGQFPPDLSCPSAVAQQLATDAADRVYISSCNFTVSQFDGHSRQLLHTAQLGYGNALSALQAGPNSTILYIASHSAGCITQQDVQSGALLASLCLNVSGSRLYGLAYDPRSAAVWTTDARLGSRGGIYQLAMDGRVLSNWSCPDAGYGFCAALALDLVHEQLLVSRLSRSGDSLLWLDLHSGAVTASFTFPSLYQARAIAVSSDGERSYAADGMDGIWLFDHRDTDEPGGRLDSAAHSSA